MIGEYLEIYLEMVFVIDDVIVSSERVSKTGADGTLLTEAKFINLSLHHLEQVSQT